MARRILSAAERLARTLDPTLLFADAGLKPPHAEQVKVLRNWREDHMLLWTRQGGKSTTGSVLACHNAIFAPQGITPTVPIVSRAERQAGELFKKAREIYKRLPYAPPLAVDSQTVLETADGARILSYPGSEETVRGLSAVTLALIDEATLVPEELRNAVSPMLSTTGGPMWCMGTARGCSGWFYDEWDDPSTTGAVVKSKVTWRDVPHIVRGFIEKERRRMPSWQFQQEYECTFIDAGEQQLITRELVERIINPAEMALF